ncbi:MAG: M13-type metalloendopeptidase, partial [Bacteroidota bacterium]
MRKKLILILSVFAILYAYNENTTVMDNSSKTNNSINLIDLDTSVSPSVDFYQYANGGWMKNNPLPDDKSRFGSFDALADLGEKQVKDLVEECSLVKHETGSIAEKIGKFYSLGMDSVKLESQKSEPLDEIFLKIDAIKDNNDLQKIIAYLHMHNIFPLFQIYADSDAKNSEMIIAQLVQGGLGMPDMDYYLDMDERSSMLQNEYKKCIKNMFMLLGVNETEAMKSAESILKFETGLAEASMTRLDRRDPFKTYNKITISELQKLSPSYDWTLYFETIGLKDIDSVNVNQTEFYKKVSKSLSEISISDWKIYLKWNVIRQSANYLSDDFADVHFTFFGKILSGSKENRARWKRVLSVTNMSLSEAIGQLYVEKYFPPEAKEKMIKLVGNLKSAYAGRIRNLSWMSDVTKDLAIQKLERINVKVGYPDKWRDYSALEVKDDSYIMNVLRANRFAFDYVISKINKPVDKLEWHMPPQMVNAYYDPSNNEIVFPAAILQPPFFFLDGDEAVNYGAIGVVIGHEMTHGFDDQGRNYDLNGNLNDWWTTEDAEKFNQKTQLLVNQHDAFIVLD